MASGAQRGSGTAAHEALLRAEQDRVVHDIARGEDLTEVLGSIARFVERRLPNVRCSILLTTRDGLRLCHAAAPGLPDEFVAAIDGIAIGPRAGSCGRAAHRGEAVVTEDVATDPSWADLRAVALRHELRACWSFPLWSPDGRLQGTFALYYDEPRAPTETEFHFAQSAAHLAELVVELRHKSSALARNEALYRSLFLSIDAGFAVVEVIPDDEGRAVDYRFVDANPTFVRQSGLDDVRGKTIRDVLPDAEAFLFEAFRRVAATGDTQRVTHHVAATGEWYEVVAFRIGRASERRVAALFSDVTAARERELRLERMSEFRRSVMELIEEGVVVGAGDAFHDRILAEVVRVTPGAQAGSLLSRDADGRFRFAAAIGYDLHELRDVRFTEHGAGFGGGGTLQPRIVTHVTHDPSLSPEQRELLENHGRNREIEAVLVVPIVVDGVLTSFLTLDNFEHADAFGEEAIEMTRVFAGHVATLVKRFALEERLHRLAYQDVLTGLPNRTAFARHVDRAIEAGATGDLAVMFVDLDDLKPINDSLGHVAGDEVLRAVAARLSACARPGDLVARLSGDEFTVALEGERPERDAAQVARELLASLAAPIRWEGHDLYVSASIGIAVHSDGAERADDLLRRADIAMYHAKQRGKSDHALFEPEMEAAPLERLLLEEALRRGLDEDQFVLHYQPRVDLRTGRIVCLEALVRWQHPERGLVPPGLFIPLAETTSLIHPLGRRILQMATRQVRAWRDEGFEDARVAVNLSARQLERPELVGEIREALADADLPASALEVEVLESVAMKDRAAAGRRLSALKELGVSVALDDFGMGYSSLSYVRELPIDTIKIDRTFLQDLLEERTDRDTLAIVRAITVLGKSFGLMVVAEGVEEERQWDQLRTVDCDEAQGYLLSRPVPAADVRALLGRRALEPD